VCLPEGSEQSPRDHKKAAGGSFFVKTKDKSKKTKDKRGATRTKRQRFRFLKAFREIKMNSFN
jgi:hypothetical protein